MNRSKTAEEVCRNLAQEKGLEISVTSVGTSQVATNPVTKEIADKADIIFVMEEYMKMEMQRYYGQDPRKIVCLGIPDAYERGEPALVRILRDELSLYLKKETG